MDPFDAVLGVRRGRDATDVATRTPTGLLARLDALCADFDAAVELSDATVTFLATGHGFRWTAQAANDYLLTDYVGAWTVAMLHFDDVRWQAYVYRELVSGVRQVSA